jgi:hypothetical protein
MVRAGLREDSLAPLARRAHEVERACGRQMDKIDWRSRATVLAVDLHEQSQPMPVAQGFVEDAVGRHQPELRVCEEELDAPRT